MPVLKSDFRPAWWIPGPHAQTIVPKLLRPLQPLRVERETFELPDGDFVHVDWNSPLDLARPIVVLLHGLRGDINSHYVNGVMAAVDRAGWQGVLMHFRGCSGMPNRHDRAYHGGDTADIGLLLDDIHRRSGGQPMACVGFSLGGNVLLRYMAERGRYARADAAVAVSVPYDLQDAAAALGVGGSRFYQRYLVERMNDALAEKFRDRPAPFDLRHALSSRTFFEFDDRVTAPLHGFADAQHYYHRCSSLGVLHDIRKPTVLIHAADDPFMTRASIPTERHLPPMVDLELSETGGHLGFVSGDSLLRPVWWLEHRIARALGEHLPCALSPGELEPVTADA